MKTIKNELSSSRSCLLGGECVLSPLSVSSDPVVPIVPFRLSNEMKSPTQTVANREFDEDEARDEERRFFG